MKASLKNHRQSPRKVRLLANLVKGKKVNEALAILTFTPKRGSLPLKKLVSSAISNAGEAISDNLIIKSIRVDKGITMKRRLPKSRGQSSLIRKRASHIKVELAENK